MALDRPPQGDASPARYNQDVRTPTGQETMNFNRIHDYCTSFAVSAMLTSAFLATAPEGFMARMTRRGGAS